MEKKLDETFRMMSVYISHYKVVVTFVPTCGDENVITNVTAKLFSHFPAPVNKNAKTKSHSTSDQNKKHSMSVLLKYYNVTK